MSNVIILGSTGSLGRKTLEVLRKHQKDFKIIGLSANKNKKLLYSQAKKFKVPLKNVILVSRDGEKKLLNLARKSQAEIIVNVLSGLAGVKPTITALESGKTVLLGNKESLVAEGKKIMKLAKKSTPPGWRHNLIPLDSEHNSIFEILKKFPNKKIEKITLPCSGGPFLNKTKSQIAKITASQALNHPVWKMGKKILIESATLINKGFEIIEARYLFNLPLNKIDVKIHPEGRIHGIVEFKNDKRKIAYFAKPDMRLHIENALLHAINKTTDREIRPLRQAEFLTKNPPHKTLPGIKIVLKIFKKNPSKMTDFLKKEEKNINDFLKGKISFSRLLQHWE